MKYLDAIAGSILSVLIFIPLVIYVPGRGPNPTVETILTVASFLFAILAGFFISRLNSRHEQIRELVSIEDAYFYALYKTAKVFGAKFADSLGNKIEKYYLAAFESPLENYYKNTASHLENIYQVLYAVKMKEKSDDSTFVSLFSTLSAIEQARNKNSVVAKDKLTGGQWLIMICLTGIILCCLFYLNTNLLFFQILIILIASMLILILLTMRDLQNLRLGGKILPVLESGQEVLESMGRLRYYNKKLVDSGVMEIPKNVKKYRLGLHLLGAKVKIVVVGK